MRDFEFKAPPQRQAVSKTDLFIQGLVNAGAAVILALLFAAALNVAERL